LDIYCGVSFPNWLQVIPIQVTHVKEVIRTVLRRRVISRYLRR
jgi:hypothetical protein